MCFSLTVTFLHFESLSHWYIVSTFYRHLLLVHRHRNTPKQVTRSGVVRYDFGKLMPQYCLRNNVGL